MICCLSLNGSSVCNLLQGLETSVLMAFMKRCLEGVSAPVRNLKNPNYFPCLKGTPGAHR